MYASFDDVQGAPIDDGLSLSFAFPDNNDYTLATVSGEVYKMELDGTVVGKFGKAGKQLGAFTTVHEIDCRNENELTVSEITGWRVQRLTLHPEKASK